MHGKGEFAKIKGSICNVPTETSNICNILPRPADANGLIVVKSKRDLKYRGYVYFEPICRNVICQALNYLKTHNKFYEDISISEGLSSKEMINFSGIDKHQDATESIHTKVISNETEYGSVEDPLSMHRTGSNETALVLKIPSIINDKYVIILNDEFFEEQAFPYHLPKGKFSYKAPRDIPISSARYFNQRLLNFNQYFASDADYILFARLVHEQHHLLSSINFAMLKIKPGTLTAGTVKSNFKGTIEKFVAKDNAFSFMSSVK